MKAAIILAALILTASPWAKKPVPEVIATVSTGIVETVGISDSLTDDAEIVDGQLTRNERYAGIEISDSEMTELAALVYLEARGEPYEGQQAVAEVVLNRVLSDEFPDTVHGVIYDTKYGVQFTPYRQVASTTPTETQYEAVNNALYGESVLDVGVLYFSRGAYNSQIYATIGGHVFCYG